MFSIEMLPAQQGDCLWIEYGEPDNIHRILIDGGTLDTYRALRQRLTSLPDTDRRIELLIVTHIDLDHIGGVEKLLSDTTLRITPDDVWFNGWEQISDELGPVDGDILATQLKSRRWPWNEAWHGAAVQVAPNLPLPRHALAGGMELTVLSPGPDELAALRDEWASVCAELDLEPGIKSPELERKARNKGVSLDVGDDELGDYLGDEEIDVSNLAVTPFVDDVSVTNRSTISVLLEYDGVRCLLPGDASSSVLNAGLERLTAATAGRVELDALKLPHHGSKHNVSKQLLERVRCHSYLCSTSGRQFHHPDKEAIARVITYGGSDPTIYFNYASVETRPWESLQLKYENSYDTEYGPDSGGLKVDLMAL